MTTTPLLLSSSSLSAFAFHSSKVDVVHAAKTRSSSSLVPCCARVSIKPDGSAARIRHFQAFRYNGIGSFSRFSATSSPPQFVVRNQAEETIEPMHSDKTYKIFSGTAKSKQCQMGPNFKIKQVKCCGKNVELPEAVVGCHVYLLYHISPSPYNNVEELLSMTEACKAGSATNITVVIPLAAKVQGKELFNLVKEIACKVAPDREVHEILSFDFVPMLCYPNPQSNTPIDAKILMSHYLENNDHESDLVILTTQKSEEVYHSFKKDFQLLPIIHDAKEVEFLRNVNGDISTILIENILRTNGGDTSFLRKNVYTCDKDTDSVKFLKDAIINSVLPRNPNKPSSE